MDIHKTIKFSPNAKEDDIMVKSESPEMDIFDETHFLKEEQKPLTNSTLKGKSNISLNDEPPELYIIDKMHFLKEEQTNSSIKGNSDFLINEVNSLKIPIIQRSRLYWCHKCKKRFKNAEIWKIHTKAHDFIENSPTDKVGSTTSPYTCPTCKKVYVYLVNLKKHIKLKHITCASFKCEFCQKTFTKKHSFSEHMLTHSQTREKPFQCDMCNKKFAKRSNLKCHIGTFECSNNCRCLSCIKGFSTTEGLQRHIRSCIDKSSGDPYFCEICSKFFLRKAYFDNHKIRHSKKKTIVCEICKKVFWNMWNLKMHQKSLTEKNTYYECEICKRKFCHKKSLITHFKTHVYNTIWFQS